MASPRVSEKDARELERRAGENSLWYFLGGERFSNGARTGLALDLEPHVHGDIVAGLQEDNWDEILAMVARGCFKSTIGCGYVTWRITKNRNFRATFLSSTFDVSEDNIDLVAQMLESDWVVDHHGSFRNPLNWSSKSLTVTGRTKFLREPTLRYKSLRSFKPGGHNDLFWIDDIEDQDTVATDDLREHTRSIMGLVYPMADEKGGKILTTGTYWHDGDAYCHKEKALGLLEEYETVDGRTRTRRVNDKRTTLHFTGADGSLRTMRVHGFYKPAVNADGSALFPEKLSLAELERLRTSTNMSASQFSAQYLLDPVGGDASNFPPEFFEGIYKPEPEGPCAIFYGVDAAQSRRIDGDYTAIVGAKVYQNGHMHIFEASRHRIDLPQLAREVVARHRKNPRAFWAIEEDNYIAGGRTTFRDTFLKEQAFPQVEWPKAGARVKKELRIRSYRGRFAERTISFGRGCEILEDELIRFPDGDRRDVADALANVHEYATVTRINEQIAAPEKIVHPRIKKFLEGEKKWPYGTRRPVWISS